MEQVTDETATDGVAEQVVDKVHEAALAVQEKASELREDGSDRLREQFELRSNQAGAQARLVADTLRRSGSELDTEGSRGAAQLTNQAADTIERIGRYLEQKSGGQLMADAELFARQRPWMLAGVGMMAGLAAARFMKASSAARYGEIRRGSGENQLPLRVAPVRSQSQVAHGSRRIDRGAGRQV